MSTIYLSNWSGYRTPGAHGPGRKWTIMCWAVAEAVSVAVDSAVDDAVFRTVDKAVGETVYDPVHDAIRVGEPIQAETLSILQRLGR